MSVDGGILTGTEKRYAGPDSNSGPAGHEAADRYPARQVILDMALESLQNRYDRNTCRFEVSPRWIPGSLAQLSGEAIREVTPRGKVERFTEFDVIYEVRESRQKARIQLQIDMEQKMPVMRERMTAGTVITEEVIDIGWVPVSRDRGQLVADPAEIMGKTLRRTLAMGEPVRKADITTEYVIEAGDAVTLLLMNNGVRIDVMAVARQDGAVDDDIRLYSDETRRTYLGKVEGPGRVLWIRTL